MPEQTTNLLSQAAEGIKFLLLALWGVVTWIGGRQIKRIDKLEEVIVPENSLDKTINQFTNTVEKGFKSVKEDMDTMHTQTRLDIREIHKRIDGIVKK